MGYYPQEDIWTRSSAFPSLKHLGFSGSASRQSEGQSPTKSWSMWWSATATKLILKVWCAGPKKKLRSETNWNGGELASLSDAGKSRIRSTPLTRASWTKGCNTGVIFSSLRGMNFSASAKMLGYENHSHVCQRG